MKECQCIAVDALDHLYVTDDFIVTHNTPQSLATVHALGAYPALVICSASLKVNWAREASRWLPGRMIAVLGKSSKRVTAAYAADRIHIVSSLDLQQQYDVVIVNYDLLTRHQVG